MKKALLTILVVILAGGFLLAGTPKAEAMNNESAAMLAGAIVLFGGPILHAITTDAYRPAPVYVDAYQAPYYTTRTEIIYERPAYRKCDRPYRGYERERRYERPVYYYYYDRGGRRGGRRY